MSRAKRGIQIGVGLIVCVAVVLVAAGVWISRTPGDIVEDYGVRAQAFQQRSWTRPEPPGWSLEEAEADVLYQAAVDDAACAPWIARKGRGIEVYESLDAVRKDGFPEPCGVLCDAIEACGPAFQTLLRGTRATSARSPAHLWSKWHLDAQGFGDYIGMLRIAQLLLADSGRREGWSEVAAIVRYGQDLTRGGGLIAAMIAVVIQQNAHTQIREALEGGRLDDTTRAMLRRELRYIDTQELGMGVAFEAEMLQTTGVLLGPEVDSPPQSIPIPGDLSWVEELFLKDLARHQWRQWKVRVDQADKPYSARLDGYDELTAQANDAINPLVGIAAAAYGKYDTRYTAMVAQRRLLLAALGEEGVVDPLTETPFRVERRDGGTVFESTALDEDKRGRLLPEDEEHVVGLRITVPARAPQ